MKVLFISRKNPHDIGGLSRFTKELTSRFPYPYHLITPASLIFPASSSLIHLCDATLLPFGVFLKLLLKKPLTVTVHGLDITFPNPLYQMMLKFFLPQTDAIIAVSRQTKSQLDKFHLKTKIAVINQGISINHLKPPNNSYLPSFKGKLILLTVGNLVLRKGHVQFIKNVFAKLSNDFVYIIAGDGPERKKIQQTINALHLNSRVFLPGRVTDQQLGAIFKKADIYVCPNQHIKGDFEGFGISTGEAAAIGLPVVASRIDGIPAIINHNLNGLLMTPTPDAFISTINKLKNPILRKKLSKKAKIYTRKNYNWPKTVQKYLKIFLEVAGKS